MATTNRLTRRIWLRSAEAALEATGAPPYQERLLREAIEGMTEFLEAYRVSFFMENPWNTSQPRANVLARLCRMSPRLPPTYYHFIEHLLDTLVDAWWHYRAAWEPERYKIRNEGVPMVHPNIANNLEFVHISLTRGLMAYGNL